jgi:hypothetical protein
MTRIFLLGCILLYGALFPRWTFSQVVSSAELSALYRQLQPSFLLMQAEFPEEDMQALLAESEADWIYFFESFDLQTQAYHNSYRAYHEVDRSTYRNQNGQWVSELQPRVFQVDGQEAAMFHMKAYSPELSYATFGSEFLAFSELYPRFSKAFELQVLQPAVTWYVGRQSTGQGLEPFRQQQLFLNIPEIWVETLIDVKTRTTQRIIHLPVRVPARLVHVWGEEDMGG